MVKKVIGINDKGEKLWERDAREYDRTITSHNTIFGISVSEIFRVIPVFIAIGMMYSNQQNLNSQMLAMGAANSASISKMVVTLGHLDNWLSSTTGKQFTDGVPSK